VGSATSLLRLLSRSETSRTSLPLVIFQLALFPLLLSGSSPTCNMFSFHSFVSELLWFLQHSPNLSPSLQWPNTSVAMHSEKKSNQCQRCSNQWMQCALRLSPMQSDIQYEACICRQLIGCSSKLVGNKKPFMARKSCSNTEKFTPYSFQDDNLNSSGSKIQRKLSLRQECCFQQQR